MSDLFLQAVELGDLEKVTKFLKEDPAIAYYKDTEALYMACYEGYYDIVSLLLEDKNIDVSDRNSLALREACEQGHFNIVNKLLTFEDINPNVFNHSSFKYSAISGHYDILKLLLKDKRTEFTPIFVNIIIDVLNFGEEESVRILFNHSKINKILMNTNKDYYDLISKKVKLLNIKNNAKSF
jgi:ankyrin repeat protein